MPETTPSSGGNSDGIEPSQLVEVVSNVLQNTGELVGQLQLGLVDAAASNVATLLSLQETLRKELERRVVKATSVIESMGRKVALSVTSRADAIREQTSGLTSRLPAEVREGLGLSEGSAEEVGSSSHGSHAPSHTEQVTVPEPLAVQPIGKPDPTKSAPRTSLGPCDLREAVGLQPSTIEALAVGPIASVAVPRVAPTEPRVAVAAEPIEPGPVATAQRIIDEAAAVGVPVTVEASTIKIATPAEIELFAKPTFPVATGTVLCDIDSYNRIAATGLLTIFGTDRTLAAGLLGIQAEPDVSFFEQIISGAGGVLFQGIGAAAGLILNSIQASMNTLIDKGSCASPIYQTIQGNRVMLNILKIIAGDVATELEIPLSQAAHRICPTRFPNADQAIDAFLANQIDPTTTEAWISLNNFCPGPYDKVLQARRSKLIPDELTTLRRRKLIDESTYSFKMRELGYLDPTDTERIFDITEVLPPLSELIRYMVRDVERTEIVERFKLDSLFTDVFRGGVKELAEKQGIPEQVMRLSWRAHWTIPGPQQLFEMLHRLPILGGFGDEATVRADVRAALVQQDILPFWIDRLLAVSFRPITRIDLRRAFNIGAILKPGVVLGYRELGYSQNNAQILADFTESLRNRGILRSVPIRLWKDGTINRAEAQKRLVEEKFPPAIIDRSLSDAAKQQRGNIAVKLFGRQQITRDEAVTRLSAHGIPPDVFNRFLDDAVLGFSRTEAADDFARGEIGETEAIALMQRQGVSAVKIDELIENARMKLTAISRRRCVNAFRRRFLDGEFTEGEFRQKLIGQGLPPLLIDEELKAVQCELVSEDKIPTTSKLTEWFNAGVLQGGEYLQRLANLGWSPEDAGRIFEITLQKMDIRSMKRAEKEAKQEAKLSDVQMRNRERQQKMSKKESTRLEKARDKAAVMRDRREKAMLKAADKLMKKLDIELFDAVRQVRAAKRLAQEEFVLRVDDSIEAVVHAVDKLPADGSKTLLEMTGEVAAAIVAFEAETATTNGSVIPMIQDRL